MTTAPPSTPKPSRCWLQFSLRTVLVLLFGCGLGCLLRAAPPYTAGDVEGLDAFTASEEAKQLLLQQGFVVGPEQFKQIYAAYVASHRLPPFVTEDSVLHA